MAAQLLIEMGKKTVSDLTASNERLRNDPRTLLALGKLFELNTLGGCTFNSQVGVIEPDNRQRAFVDMLVDATAWPYLADLMSETEMIVIAQPFRHARSEPDDPTLPLPVPLTVETYPDGSKRLYSITHMVPWPAQEAVEALTTTARRLATKYKDSLNKHALCVEAIDPVWGRQDALLDALIPCMRAWNRRHSRH